MQQRRARRCALGHAARTRETRVAGAREEKSGRDDQGEKKQKKKRKKKKKKKKKKEEEAVLGHGTGRAAESVRTIRAKPSRSWQSARNKYAIRNAACYRDYYVNCPYQRPA
ncbi:hypothetical protein EAI_01486 [Harpegnathos saltator]|uniref:Uncharacterized protein n=1 Tax=Harpegnathos saltator TaxID=610380 RepID=E2BPE1_HARSA|nr:hypothetical protein EAI_01486 [Harpegnathos saltator]